MKGPYKTIAKKFVSKTIEFDNKHFENCSFSNCVFLFSGGTPPVLIGCNFDNCSWQFAGHAANTLGFLTGLYAGGFDQMVETTFHGIRKGQFLEVPVNHKPNKNKSVSIPKDATAHPLVSRVPRIVKVPKSSS